MVKVVIVGGVMFDVAQVEINVDFSGWILDRSLYNIVVKYHTELFLIILLVFVYFRVIITFIYSYNKHRAFRANTCDNHLLRSSSYTFALNMI